jgi:uncharacterized protein (TIGR00725 family)
MAIDSSRQLMIAVCGAGHADSALDAVAEAVGRAIAESGALLICGGRGGVMKAACRAATHARLTRTCWFRLSRTSTDT